MSLRLSCLLFLAALGFLSGCTPAGPVKHPVSGSVTYKGKPIADGMIYFDPQDNPHAPRGGTAIKDGNYDTQENKGVVPGKYRVRITALDPTSLSTLPPKYDADGFNVNAAAPRELVPEKFNLNSKLTVDVKEEGPNVFDFHLD